MVIAVFAVVSGLAAVLSTAAALYTASQIQGSTKQVDSAIAEIASAASAAQDEARSLKDQFGQMKRQADASEGQLKAAKAQTGAISKQTAAIKNSADAAIKTAGAQIASAEAQRRAAEQDELAAKAAASSNLPSLFLSSFDLGAPDANQVKTLGLTSKFKPTFGNNGGVMYRPTARGAITWDKPTPADRLKYNWGMGGNEISIAHGGTYFPVGDEYVPVTKAQADDITKGTAILYFYGRVDYIDAANTPHSWCFAYEMHFPKKDGPFFFSFGGPEWHCQT